MAAVHVVLRRFTVHSVLEEVDEGFDEEGFDEEVFDEEVFDEEVFDEELNCVNRSPGHFTSSGRAFKYQASKERKLGRTSKTMITYGHTN
ncbi:hypothetical protein PG988_001905 [Apiospora saccharicola]